MAALSATSPPFWMLLAGGMCTGPCSRKSLGGSCIPIAEAEDVVCHVDHMPALIASVSRRTVLR